MMMLFAPRNVTSGASKGLRKNFLSRFARHILRPLINYAIIRPLHRSTSLTPITFVMLRYEAEHSLAFRICQSN